MEKIDRAIHTVGDPALYIWTQFASSLLLVPDIAWAVIKKVHGDKIPEGLKGKSLNQALFDTIEYNPNAFTQVAGGIAGIMGTFKNPVVQKVIGGLKKGAPIGGDMLTALDIGGRTGIGIGGIRAIEGQLAEFIDPETDYHGGAEEFLQTVGGFGLFHGASYNVRQALQSPSGQKMLDTLSKKYPKILDSIRKNPNRQIEQMLYKELGVTKDISKSDKALIRHMARHIEGRYRIKPKPDVVTRTRPGRTAIPGSD
ncbi:unnamed protein product, partial [marine sediment metagenome]